MKRIRLRREDDDYVGDHRRIKAALARFGYDCTLEEADALWQRYSDSMCAGWMTLPNDDAELLACVHPYFVTEEDVIPW